MATNHKNFVIKNGLEVTNGNVGIGNANPSEKLEVRGSTDTTIRIHNEDDSEATVYFHNTGSNDRKIVAADADMIFYGGSGAADEHLRIEHSGRVGIGTNSPTDNLHIFDDAVDCNIKIQSTASGTDARINLVGNSTGVSQIRFGDEVSINVGLITYDHSDDSLSFRTNSTERINILSDGTVDFKDNNISNVGTIALDSIKGDADDNTNITFAGSDTITFKAGSISPALTINTTSVKIEDDQKFVAGTGNDLEIYHDGSSSYIKTTNAASNTFIQTALGLQIRTGTTAPKYAVNVVANAGVSLAYNNSEKFVTTNTGVTVTGTVTADGLSLGDNEKAKFGANDDLQIYHNSSNNNSIINESGPGNLVIGADNNFEIKNTAGTEFKAKFITDGAVELYYDNSKKFETTSGGATVTGTLTATAFSGDGSALTGISTDVVNDTTPQLGGTLDTNGNLIQFGDSSSATDDRLQFGASQDLQIYHDGSRSYISDKGTGALRILASDVKIKNAADNEQIATFSQNGAVELYYDNSKKFETTSTGIEVSGSGNVQSLITSTGAQSDLFFKCKDTAYSTIIFGDQNNAHRRGIRYDANTDKLEFKGVNMTANHISIDSSGNVNVAGNVTLEGELRGPASFVIDPAAVGNNTGTVVIKGDLQIDGTTTTINSTTLTVNDKNIVLASGAANAAAADGAGITVDTANATLLYKSTPDAWTFNKKVGIGTDAPSAPLHISGAGASTALIKIEDNDNGFAASEIGVENGGRDLKIAAPQDIYFEDVDTGARHVYIESGGNVGIGTDNPESELHVKGVIQLDGTTAAFNNNFSKIYQNSSSSVDYGLQLRHYQGDTDDVDASITIGGNGGTREDNIVFYRSDGSGGSTETMRIDEGGNVGINTTNLNAQLHVAGSSTSTTFGIHYQNTDDNGAVDALAITNLYDRDIGIRLRTGDSNGENQASRWTIWNDGNVSNATLNNRFNISPGAVNDVANGITILQNNNVGMGTGSPSDRLHVLGSIKVEAVAPIIKLAETGVTGNPSWWIVQDAGNFSLRNNNASPYPFRIATKGTNSDSTDFVAFGGDTIQDALTLTAHGTNPTYLDLRGNNANARMRYFEGTTERWNIGYDTNANAFTFYDTQNSATQLVLKDGGNVGIGTSNPSERLEVDGVILSSGPIVDTAWYRETWPAYNETTATLAGNDLGTWTLTGGTLATGTAAYHEVDLARLPAGLKAVRWNGGGATSYLTSPTIDLDNFRTNRKITTVDQTGSVADKSVSDSRLYLTMLLAAQSMDNSAEYMEIELSNDDGVTFHGHQAFVWQDNDADNDDITDTTWRKVVIDISEYTYASSTASSYGFKIRFKGTGTGGADGYGVSNIYIHDAPIPNKLKAKTLKLGDSTLTEANDLDYDEFLEIVSNNGNFKGLVLNDSRFERDNYVGISSSDSLVLASDELNAGNNSSIDFRIDGKDRMKLYTSTDAGASVAHLQLIGHTTPTDRSNWRITAEDNGTNGKFSISDYSGASWNQNFVILEDGNVGIGTVSPSEKLEVNGNISIDTPNPNFYFQPSSDTQQARITYRKSDGTTAANFRWNYSTQAYEFYTGSSQRFNIQSDGNVGIGTTSPSTKLDVVGSITASNDLIVGDEIRNNTPSDFWANDNTFINLNGVGNLTHMGSFQTVLTSNGYRTSTSAQWKSLGINSSTGAAQISLDPTGYITFGAESNKADGSSHIVSERLRIESDGNIKAKSATQYKGFHLVKADGGTVAQLVGHASNNDEGGLNLWDSSVKKVQILANGTSYLMGGKVGIGTDDPSTKLHVYGTQNAGGILVEDSSTSSPAPAIKVIGKRSDANAGHSFSGKLLLARNYTGGKITNNITLGTLGFGGNHTDGTMANILYAASIHGIAEDSFDSATDMPTALTFHTGSVGRSGDASNVLIGAERMRIDSSGNVGIGESSPDTSLHITDTASPMITLENPNNNTAVRATYIRHKFDDGFGGEILCLRPSGAAATGAEISFRVGGINVANQKMVIESTGNVGIGTTSPSTKLDVVGHIKVDSGPVLENAGSGSSLQITTPTGYCTIGSNNTTYAHFYTDRGRFFFNKFIVVDSGIFAAYNEDLHLTTDATASNKRLNILHSNGNVGINNTAPSAKLQVNTNNTTYFKLTSDTLGDRFVVDQYGQLGLDVAEANISARLHITTASDKGILVEDVSGDTVFEADDGNGHVTVGNRLYIGGTTNYLSSLPTNYGSIQVNGSGGGGYEGYSIDGRAVFMHDGSTTMGLYDDVNDHWVIKHSMQSFDSITMIYGANGAERIRIAGNGNVGIGTSVTSPSTVLDVQGSNDPDPLHVVRGGTITSDQVSMKFEATNNRWFGKGIDNNPYWSTSSNVSTGENLFQVVKDIALGSSDNLNSLTDGYYTWVNNQPTNSPGNPYMAMLQLSDNNQKIQMAFGSSSSGRLYVRRADSGTFYGWTEFARINETSNFTATPQINGNDILSTATGLSTNPSGPIYWSSNSLTTFDPPGGGTGTDTATDVALGLASGNRIVGWADGYIRSLFEWNASSDILIGQGSTSLIAGINLLPGSAGLAKVNGEEILTKNSVGEVNNETHTSDGQYDITLFGTAGGAAQSGAFNSKLIIKGGSSQTRTLELFQDAGGYATINTSYSSNYLDFTGFNRLRLNQQLDLNGNDIIEVEDISLRDKIKHDGDTDTFMQFHANDQWRVVTGNVERLEVNNTQTIVSTDLLVGSDLTTSLWAEIKSSGLFMKRPITLLPNGGGDATSSTTTMNSEDLVFMGKHWNGSASVDNYFKMSYDVESTTPTGKVYFAFGLDNNASGVATLSSDGTWDFNGNNLTEVEDIGLRHRIFHDGDTNCYIEFHANDQWRVVTGNVERLEVNNTQTTINQNATIVGSTTITKDGDALNLRSTTNAAAVRVTFSSDVPDAQIGHIEYTHIDTAAYGSKEALILGGTETTMTILADGKLMYSEGIYSKPGSGTGAGTRKDANWDTAYGWGNHGSAGYATETYVGTQISNLVNSAPSTLDTLNELAAALGDDANFSTTITNSIATKLPLAGGQMTGNIDLNGNDIIEVEDISLRDRIKHDGDTNTFMQFHAADQWRVVTGNVERLEVNNTQTTVNQNLSVNGLLSATTKSFIIDHPTKEGMKLRHGSLEGPENGVYVRGRLKGNNTIELPDYWTGLVDEDTITVNLTAIGRESSLHKVVDIYDNTVVVDSEDGNINCFYTVFGERKDVEKVEVEY